METQSVMVRLANALSWKILTIVFGISLGTIMIAVISVAMYKANQVQMISKDRLITGNDTSWIEEANIHQLSVSTLCFDEYPYCTGYDESAECIANGGHSCFNNVTIYGKLKFAEGAGYEGATTFIDFSIGDWHCAADEFDNVQCTGGTFYPGTLGLPMYLDPDHFAVIRRSGNTLILDSESITFTGDVFDSVRFKGIAYFDDRIIIGDHSSFVRFSDRLKIIGFDLTEFVDNVIFASDVTINGRIVGANLKLDDDVNVDMYGDHTFMLQHTGDLDVCAPTGTAKLCGETVVLEGDEVQIIGSVTNIVHFASGIQVDGPTIFTGGQVAGDLTVDNLDVTTKLHALDLAEVDNLLKVNGETQTGLLNVAGTSHLSWTFVDKSLTVSNLSTFYGGALFYNGAYFTGPSLTVETNDLTINSDGLIDIQNGLGEICIGTHDSSATALEDKCALYVEPGPDSCVHVGCLEADVLVINEFDYDDAELETLHVSDKVCLMGSNSNTSEWNPGVCQLYADISDTGGMIQVNDLSVGQMLVLNSELHTSYENHQGTEWHYGEEHHTNEEYHTNKEFHSGEVWNSGLTKLENTEIYDKFYVYSYLQETMLLYKTRIGGGRYSYNTPAWTSNIYGIPDWWHNRKVVYINADLYVNGYIWADSILTKQQQFAGQDTIGGVYGNNPGCQFAPPYTSSDIRQKTNLTEIDPVDSIQRIDNLKVYDFEFKDEFIKPRIRDPGTHRGVIAQEIQEIIPDAVEEFQHYLVVKYQVIIPDLVNAVKGLLKINEMLRQDYDELLLRVDELEKRLSS